MRRNYKIPLTSSIIKSPRDIWKGYSAAKVRKAIAKTAGSWVDIDANKLISDLYSFRKIGSRIAKK